MIYKNIPKSSADLLVNLASKNICIITLNNPGKRNPLSSSIISKMQEIFNYLKKNKKIKVVIIKSTGNVFCSGHDLKEIKKSNNKQETLKKLFNKCSKMMLSINQLPQPVIAAVDGTAAAAGCQLVASCDLVYCTEESIFQTPGVNIGLFCSTPMVAISRKINIKNMMHMLLTGDTINAKDAQAYGIANKVYNNKVLDKKVKSLANKIASKSSQSISIGKEAFYQQLEMPISEAYKHTSKVMIKNMEFNDAKEGITAFMEKRRPKWTEE